MIVFKAHSKPVYSLKFSPDGSKLLTSGGDELMRLWSLEPINQLHEWSGSQFSAPIAYSPDGKFLAHGGYTTQVWALAQPSEPVIDVKSGYSDSVSFSPDGTVFAAHGEPGFRRWEMPGGQKLPGGWGGTRESIRSRQFPIGGIAFSPDGKVCATCFGVLTNDRYDSVLYLWDAHSGQLRGSLHASKSSHHPERICYSPDGCLLVGLYGAQLRAWQVKDEKEVAIRTVGKKHFKDLAFTPDGRRLATVSTDESVRLWDTATWAEVGAFEWEIGKLNAVDVSPDGCRFAAGGSRGKVIVWDAER